MSSEKEFTVEPLELKGRGNKKKKTEEDDTIIRTVRSDHGYPKITLPKTFLKIGMKLNQDVVIEKRGSNPLNWEIVIKPATTALEKH